MYVCDKCVELCVDVIRNEGEFDQVFGLLQPDEGSGDPFRPDAFELARGTSSAELAAYGEHGRKGVERSRFMLQAVERRLAMREGDDPARDAILASPGSAFLRGKSRAELLTLQQNSRNELRRYEEALRIATTVIAERGEQAG